MLVSLQAVLVVALLGVEAVDDVTLTPGQKEYLANARIAAKAGSEAAERELLEEFGKNSFKFSLRHLGSSDLAELSAAELLKRVETELKNAEYVFTFGLDEASLKQHPGQPGWTLKSLDDFGHIPSMWELKVASNLTKGIPEGEWKILDAEETGLYRLPGFTKPGSPALIETKYRPTYASGNLRRVDTGIYRYGVYSPVYRQDVLRDRAVLMGVDGGGWTTVCNKSVAGINRWSRWVGNLDLINCDANFAGGYKQVLFGTIDDQLHTFLANSKVTANLGGSLPRLVHQILAPEATLRPIESSMYIEGGVLGPANMDHMKLFVANFPDLFGTPQADETRAFCEKHHIPLAWALGDGQIRSVETSSKLDWLPLEPLMTWKVGQARLLDPSSWLAMNTTAPPPSDTDATTWEKVQEEASSVRSTRKVTKADIESWWTKLQERGGAVLPRRGDECALTSMDLCFGTSGDPGRLGECLCREPPRPHATTRTATEQTGLVLV